MEESSSPQVEVGFGSAFLKLPHLCTIFMDSSLEVNTYERIHVVHIFSALFPLSNFFSLSLLSDCYFEDKQRICNKLSLCENLS